MLFLIFAFAILFTACQNTPCTCKISDEEITEMQEDYKEVSKYRPYPSESDHPSKGKEPNFWSGDIIGYRWALNDSFDLIHRRFRIEEKPDGYWFYLKVKWVNSGARDDYPELPYYSFEKRISKLTWVKALVLIENSCIWTSPRYVFEYLNKGQYFRSFEGAMGVPHPLTGLNHHRVLRWSDDPKIVDLLNDLSVLMLTN